MNGAAPRARNGAAGLLFLGLLLGVGLGFVVVRDHFGVDSLGVRQTDGIGVGAAFFHGDSSGRALGLTLVRAPCRVPWAGRRAPRMPGPASRDAQRSA